MLSIKSIAKYNKVMAQLFKNHPLFLGKKRVIHLLLMLTDNTAFVQLDDTFFYMIEFF